MKVVICTISQATSLRRAMYRTLKPPRLVSSQLPFSFIRFRKVFTCQSFAPHSFVGYRPQYRYPGSTSALAQHRPQSLAAGVGEPACEERDNISLCSHVMCRHGAMTQGILKAGTSNWWRDSILFLAYEPLRRAIQESFFGIDTIEETVGEAVYSLEAPLGGPTFVISL